MYVIIDDTFPINSITHKPIFAYCTKPTEIWIPVIEKSLAKVIGGNYSSLIGHSIEEGLKLLTSNPCCTLCWKSQYNNKPVDDNMDDVFNSIDRSLGNVVLISAQIKPNCIYIRFIYSFLYPFHFIFFFSSISVSIYFILL